MAELRIYDDIGLGGMSAAQIADQLEAITAPELDIRINSPGGSVFDGIAIYNAIERHPAKVTMYIDGLAGSAASFIAMAGDEIVINRYAKMMIHDASGIVVGAAADMGAMAGVLNMLSQTIAQVYADRAGGTTEQWRQAMLTETWYSAEDAVQAGLADRISGPASRTKTATPPRQGAYGQAVAVAAARRTRKLRLTTS
ncbi:head maturation protease, ClpP-related [Mycolicibacterium septicum]|uniref:ATP-dependent Clp protease proteolytic subunit n=1 Tax=Mycolicibacterium septicum TaxID=98668 RepID=A0ABW9LND1_9MYCO